jgi:hypothetical protein
LARDQIWIQVERQPSFWLLKTSLISLQPSKVVLLLDFLKDFCHLSVCAFFTRRIKDTTLSSKDKPSPLLRDSCSSWIGIFSFAQGTAPALPLPFSFVGVWRAKLDCLGNRHDLLYAVVDVSKHPQTITHHVNVAHGKEMNALKLCNSSSTLASVEKGFEGKLVDL